MRQRSVIFLIVCFVFLSLFAITSSAQAVNSEYLYVGHADTGMLTIVDTNSNLMVNSSPITSNIQGLVASPAGDYLIASDWYGKQILFIQPLTNIVLFKVPVSGVPYGLAVSNDGKTVYVAIFYEDNFDPGRHVAVIDVPSRSVRTYIELPYTEIFTYGHPRALALDKTGTYLYVLLEHNDLGTNSTVEIIDTNTCQFVNNSYPIPLGTDLVLSPDGKFVYAVSNYNNYSTNGTITVLNANTYLTIYKTITTDKFPFSIAFNKDGTSYYVTSNNIVANEYFIKYNYPADTVNTRVTLSADNPGATATYPFKVAVSNMGNVYVGHGTTVSVYDGNTNALIKDLSPNHGQPYHMAFIIPSMELYSSHLVTFYTKTCYNMLAVADVNVSVYNSDDQFLYSGVTGSDGVVAFTLLPNAQYNILFNQSPNVNQWYNLTPSSSSYTVPIPFSQVIGLTKWSDTIINTTNEYETSWTISHPYNSSTGAAWMNSSYTDATATSAGFFLYKNGSFMGTDTLIDQTLDSSAPFMANFSIAGATGNSYYIVIKSNSTDGNKTYSTGLAYKFPGPKVLAGVFPSEWYFWLAWALVLIFYSVGTVTKKGLFAIFGAVMGYILTDWGWFSLVYPDYISLPAQGLVFILGIVVYLTERERYT